MTEKEKLALLEETFDIDEGSLNADMKLNDLACWDSMRALSLIVMLDDEFNKELKGKTIRTFKTVQDILDQMEK